MCPENKKAQYHTKASTLPARVAVPILMPCTGDQSDGQIEQRGSHQMGVRRSHSPEPADLGRCFVRTPARHARIYVIVRDVSLPILAS